MKTPIKKRLKDILLFIGLITLLAIFGVISGVTPVGYNYTAACFGLGLNMIVSILAGFQAFSGKRLWWIRYMGSSIFLPAMIGVAALNLVYASFPNWRLILPLAAMYPIAALLPFLDERLSRFLFIESFAPRTRLGKNILYLALAIGPAAGIFGATLSKVARRSGDGVIGYSILGFVAHLFFVWGTVTMVYQAWELRPWKKTGKEQ